MERDFRYLRDVHGDAGARAIFERICAELLQAQYGEMAHNIRVTQGDGGVDILIGDFSVPIQNYQCKFFLDGIGDSQKKQIRESFQRAISSTVYRMDKWILCVPCTLSFSEFEWWSDWRDRQKKQYNIEISLYEGGYLISQLKKYNLYQTTFDDDIRIKLDSILSSSEKKTEKTSVNKLGLGLSTLSEGEFLGREDELRQIDQHMRQHRNPTIVFGFPGMGKTELVIEYGRRKMSDCHVHFVRFEQSFFYTVVNSISSAFSGYSKLLPNGQPKSDEFIFQEVMQMLRGQSAEDILIIDNVDSETEEFSQLCDERFTALCQLPMRLIITTRTRCEGSGFEVGVLEKHYLHQLMTRFVELSADQMDALIDAVDAHTLTVELIARTLKYSIPRISPGVMLEQLHNRDMGTPVFARIASQKDRKRKKRRIEEHLLELFRINELPADEVRYMCNAFCIPEKGMDLGLFALSCPDFEQDKFVHLVERGWIRLDENTDIISVHPLIPEITRKACNLDFQAVRDFVDKLSSFIDNRPERVTQVIGVYRRINDCLSIPEESINRYKEIEYGWALAEARFYLGLAVSEILIKIPYDFCKFLSEHCDKSYWPVWIENDVHNCHLKLLDDTKALLALVYRDYLVSAEERKALVEKDRRELELSGNEFVDETLESLFGSFSLEKEKEEGRGTYARDLHLGRNYCVLGRLPKAKKHLSRACMAMEQLVERCNDLPVGFDSECMDTWLKLGNVGVDLQDYKTGFKFFKKCADAPNVTGINNLGWMYLHGYGCEKDYNQAISLFERAAMDSDSPSIASNRHLGKIYLGKHPDALDFGATNPEKALYHLKRAKDLGATDVDQLIINAESQVHKL